MIDSTSKYNYSSCIQQYGRAPTQIDIPYVLVSQKLFRSLPAPGDTVGTVYSSQLSAVSYTPETIIVASVANITELRLSLKTCQLTASVNNILAKSVFTTGKKEF